MEEILCDKPTHLLPMTHWENIVLPIPATLSSAMLETLVLKEDMLFPGDTERVPLNYKLWLPHGYFDLLVHRDQQV